MAACPPQAFRAASFRAEKRGVEPVGDTPLPQKIATTTPGRRRRYESGAGRIHYAADVKQTVVLEQIRQEPSTDIDSEHDLPADLPAASAAHVREMLSLALR